MAWVRLDDGCPNHPKLVRAGAEAAWLWSAALCYSNAHKLDGKLDKDILPAIYVPLASKAPRLADVLVRVGLWHDEGDHFAIHDYEDYQEQALKDSVEARREYERERKRLARSGTKGGSRPGQRPGQRPGHVRDKSRDTAGAVPSVTRADPGPARPVPSQPNPVSTTSAAHDPVSQDHTGSAGVCEGVSDPPRRRTRAPAASTEPKVSVLVWEAYSAEYQRRYGSAPVSNAKVRGQLAQFVARVPAAEAPDVARTYVWSNHSRYVAACHPVGMLLQDAEALTTQLRTGRSVTRHSAVQLDRRAGRGEEYEQVIAELEAEREVAHG